MSFSDETIYTDEELFNEWQESLDEDAFKAITERYLTKAYGVAYHILFSQSSAEDAVQESFLRIINHRKSFKKGAQFSPWYFSILRRICIDLLRRKKTQLAIQNLLPFEVHNEPHYGLNLSLINTLAQNERDVVYYRIVCDMSFEEIAAAVGCSFEAAKKRAQRGIQHLRKHLEENSPEIKAVF